MPRRLDPSKGLPGLFQPSKASGDDMGFLVRPEGGSKKPRRRTPKALAAPASTISQISGKHARPQPAPPTATAASDVAPPTTATSSGAFERPIVLALAAPPLAPPALAAPALAPAALAPDPAAEAREQLLREAPPVCRVPELVARPAPISFADAVTFARCTLAWLTWRARAPESTL